MNKYIKFPCDENNNKKSMQTNTVCHMHASGFLCGLSWSSAVGFQGQPPTLHWLYGYGWVVSSLIFEATDDLGTRLSRPPLRASALLHCCQGNTQRPQTRRRQVATCWQTTIEVLMWLLQLDMVLFSEPQQQLSPQTLTNAFIWAINREFILLHLSNVCMRELSYFTSVLWILNSFYTNW